MQARQSKIDLKEMKKLINKAVQILSYCNAICLFKRKIQLWAYLDKRYQYLAQPSNPVTNELLGPDLEQKISDINKTTEAGKKLYMKSRYYNVEKRKIDYRTDTKYHNNFNHTRRGRYGNNGCYLSQNTRFKQDTKRQFSQQKSEFWGRKNFRRAGQEIKTIGTTLDKGEGLHVDNGY